MDYALESIVFASVGLFSTSFAKLCELNYFEKAYDITSRLCTECFLDEPY